MSENIAFINGSLKLFLKQRCSCIGSFPTSYIKHEEIRNLNDGIKLSDTFVVRLSCYPYACNVCHMPYKVGIDTSNIDIITNIGEPDAKREENFNS